MIEVVGAPSIRVNYINPLCTDSKVILTIDTTLGSTDKAEEIIWKIFGGNGLEDSIHSFSPEIILSKDSQYVIKTSLETAKGCFATFYDTIIPNLSPRLTIENDSICLFNELRLQSNYSGSNYEHNWSFSNLNYSNTNTIDVTFNEIGTYDFELSILDKSSMCSDTSRFEVYVGESIESNLASSIICRDQLNEIRAIIKLDTFDDIKDISWRKQGTIVSKGPTTFIESNKNEFIELNVESEFGCLFNRDYSLSIDTISNPSVVISKAIGTIPFETQIQVENLDSLDVYHVFIEDTFLLNDITLSIDSKGLYDLKTIFTNRNQCTYISSNKLIGYDDTPDLGISSISIEKLQNQTLLNLVFYNNSNIEIQSFEFEAFLENGNRINFLETEQILPGEELFLQTPIISNSSDSDPLYCVNISTVNGDADLVTSNNYLCSQNKAQLHIYPNPFLDGISLRFDSNLESDIDFVIYSVSGSPVIQGEIGKNLFSPEYFLSLNKLSSGEYTLILKNNEFEIINKIIKL